MIGAGMLGENGRGIIEAAQGYRDLAKEYLTAEQKKRLDAIYGPAQAAAEEAAKTGPLVARAHQMPDANPQLQGQIAGSREAAQQPFALERQQQSSDLALRNAQQTPTELRKNLELLPPDQRAQAAAGAIPGNAQPEKEKLYQSYAQEEAAAGRMPKSREEFWSSQARASAMSINTAPGFEAAQTQARLDVDKKAAIEIGEQALAGRRLMPLLDEVMRLADKTPGGWGGPVAAQMARAFSSAGLPVTEGMSNAELLSSVSQRLIPIVREPGPTSEKELAIYLRAVPGLMQSQEGRVKVAEITKRMVDRSVEIARVYREHLGKPELFDKLAELDKPLLTDDQRAAVLSVSGLAPTANPTTREEYDRLAPGTVFTAPDGSLRRKP
jgi:hypothetical protein